MIFACKLSIVWKARPNSKKIFEQSTTGDGSEEPASGGTMVSVEKLKEYEETIASLRQKQEKAQEDATKLQ